MADEWDIEALSYDELVALNRRVVARLKQLNALRSQYHMLALNRGQRVSFDAGPQHGGRLIATVLKFNRKTVSVLTDEGDQWNVSPHLLSPVKDVTPRPPPPNSKTARQGDR